MDQKPGQFHGSFPIVASWSVIHTTPKTYSSTCSDCKKKTLITACIGHSDILCVLCCWCMVIGWEWLCCVCFSYHVLSLFGYVCVLALVGMLWGIYCSQDTVNSPNSSLNKFTCVTICHDWNLFLFNTSTVFFMMLGMALEHEINVLEESYCIDVLSGHFTLQNAPQM